MKDMHVVMRETDELIPYERNQKKHDEKQVRNVANSIKRFGWQQPIVVDSKDVVVIGHCRLLAAKKLGMKQVPVVVADELTEDEVRELRIADNKTNESPWDFEMLETDMAELDFEGFEFDFGDPFAEKGENSGDASVTEDDFDAEPPEEPKAKLGDIYQLGRHRLMCGDSTNSDDVARLMDGRTAHILLTDPPYGINIVKKNNVGGSGMTKFKGSKQNKIVGVTDYMPIKNDDTTDAARESYEIAKTCTENQIIFGGNYFTDFLKPKSCWIVWDKENTGNFADVELAWTSFDKGAKLYKWLWNGLCRAGDRETELQKRIHPTQKPVGMLANIIQDFTKEDDLVLDLFGGSGSTLIACEKTDRQCVMMEYESHYIDTIISRWETLTGEKAVLLNDASAGR